MDYKSKIGEECGVFAIYDPGGGCARSVYYGLYALQHRGQESCGIAVNKDRDIYHYKDMGLVNEVFTEDILQKLDGTMAVGHVRYSTTGESLRENAQPLVLRYVKGNIALAHNGNLVNKNELVDELSQTGAIFQTTTDTETIAYMIAKQRLSTKSIEAAVANTIDKLTGSFSLIVMSPTKLIAARDPWGFRPLCIGKKGDAVIFSSETCALDSIGAEFVRDVEPGEIVVVQGGKIKTIDTYKGTKPKSMCIFEYIYFARPDSTIEGQNAHESRMLAGKYLARQKPVDADVVIGVPDSGISAALGYSLESGIPYGLGFIKNKYIGRTFIQPSQSMRENAVRIKLNVLKDTVAGKRVIMIDDSIVRGTTSKRIVNLLREAGATEVHVRSSSPPFMWPCYFGTDIPSRDQLIACNHSIEEIKDVINADSLEFLSLENLGKVTPHTAPGFCTGCFSGHYPVPVDLTGEED
ncbi:MAG: amidophosphoribosyltransferase [Oscillospiraceae bacterium]|nr:amidophosphoribosyltransferase [Oscillospiraceae bacterium]